MPAVAAGTSASPLTLGLSARQLTALVNGISRFYERSSEIAMNS
jgi:hypothetical protein